VFYTTLPRFSWWLSAGVLSQLAFREWRNIPGIRDGEPLSKFHLTAKVPRALIDLMERVDHAHL